MNFRDNKYSEADLREYVKNYPEKCDWSFWWDISLYQTLSEQFIRDFQDQVDWSFIFVEQNLSEEFLIEFIERVDIEWLEDNKKIPEEVKNRIINLKKVIDQ